MNEFSLTWIITLKKVLKEWKNINHADTNQKKAGVGTWNSETYRNRRQNCGCQRDGGRKKWGLVQWALWVSMSFSFTLWKSSRDLSHNNVNILNTAELYTLKMVKMVNFLPPFKRILLDLSTTMKKRIKKKAGVASYIYCYSVAKSCRTLCSPMLCTPVSAVLHSLPEFAQIDIHWVGDAI